MGTEGLGRGARDHERLRTTVLLPTEIRPGIL